MKRISAIVIVLFAAAVGSAFAQTNVPTAAMPPMLVSTNMVATNALAQDMVSATPTSAVTATNNPSGRTMTLQDCFAEALKHNFDIAYERFEPQKSLYDVYAAYAGYDPVLSLSAQHRHDTTGGNQLTNQIVVFRENNVNSDLVGATPWGMTYDFNGTAQDTTTEENSSGSASLSVTQPLLKNFWIDSTRLAISAAKNNLKESEQALRNQAITTITAVENAYYELIYARDYVNVQQEALDLAQKQLSDDKQRVEVGSLAPLDVQQDESQAAQSRANLISAQYNFATSQNALKTLITDKYTAWHDVDINPAGTMDAIRQVFDLQDSWTKGMTQRPDLIQAKIDVEQQGIQLKYDQNQIFPQLDLIGSYGYNGSGQEFNDTFGQIRDANRPTYSYGAQFSIPLSNAKARNGYKVSKANEAELLITLKKLEQTVMVDIDNAVKQAESTYESVQATREARVYAAAALDAEQKKYAVGKSTTFTVLQLQNNLTSARSQEIRALANYNEALSNLAQQEGSTLERRQIDFSVK